MAKKPVAVPKMAEIEKCPTGVAGFDQVTGGGLPRGRATLVYGSPGAGKTIFGLGFLVNGARRFNEPGLLVTFQERPSDLVIDVQSFGWDLGPLIDKNRIFIEYVLVEPDRLLPNEEGNLEGLLVRIQAAIEATGARRLVLDGIDYLMAGFSGADWVRYEFRRLLDWLRDRDMTVFVTAEMNETGGTRFEVEPYLVDCVVRLENRTDEDVATRSLQVSKYRGSAHSADRHPFIIGGSGIEVLPIKTVGLDYEALEDRVPTGTRGLDDMLEGGGFFRGSSILVSGNAGTGKTSFAAAFSHAVCRKRKRCLYFSFEESPDQIVRNMRSIGLDLKSQLQRKRLLIRSVRPNESNLEEHLASIQNLVSTFDPFAVVFDPINSFLHVSDSRRTRTFFMRLIDFFKDQRITCLATSLSHDEGSEKSTDLGISSLMDTWIDLKNIISRGEQNRLLSLIKSRGMAHSHQVRAYRIMDKGIEFENVDTGKEGLKGPLKGMTIPDDDLDPASGKRGDHGD